MSSMGLMRVGRRTARAAAAVAGKRSATSAIAVAVSDRQLFHSARDAATPTFINRNVRCQSTQAAANSDAGAAANAQTEESTDPEARILKTALAHVPELGWTIEALAAGATDLGYPSVAHGMFPRGAIELVDHFMDSCLAQVRQTLIINTEKLQGMTVADRLKFGVRSRLELLAPFMPQWPQAMALGAQPPNTPTTMKKLAKLSDEIWYFAGDKSTDASWYTKRAILTGIYASTELFMLSDKSPDFQDTWAFLDRRVDETIQLGELPQNLNDMAGMASIGLQSMFSAVTSLAGPLAGQIIASSPMSHVPNPISAVGSVVPPSLVSAVASGLPPSPFSGPTPVSSPATTGAMAFESKDLREIDEELEKLGGADTTERRS